MMQVQMGCWMFVLTILLFNDARCQIQDDHNVIYLSPNIFTSNTGKGLTRKNLLTRHRHIPKGEVTVDLKIPMTELTRTLLEATIPNSQVPNVNYELANPKFEFLKTKLKSSEPKNHQYSYSDPISGTYKFGYRMHDQYREEERRANGVTFGQYGWMDLTGTWHHTRFIADKKGYRVIPSVPSHPVYHPASVYEPPFSHMISPGFHPLGQHGIHSTINQHFRPPTVGRPPIAHQLSTDGNKNYYDDTESNVQHNVYNKFPFRGPQQQSNKVFPAYVEKFTKPNQEMMSLSNIRNKFQQSLRPPPPPLSKPLVIERPPLTYDDWWLEPSKTGEPSITIPIHDQQGLFTPPVAIQNLVSDFSSFDFPQTSIYQQPLLSPNHIQSKPLLVANKPPLLANKPLFAPNRPPPVVNQPLFAPNSPPPVVNKPLLTPNNPLIIANKPLHVPNNPVVVTNKPLLTSSNLLFVANKPLLVPNNHLAVVNKPSHLPNKPVHVANRPLLAPNKPISDDNVDYLLLSDEFDEIDGAIENDPAYGYIQDLQELQDDLNLEKIHQFNKKPIEDTNINPIETDFGTKISELSSSELSSAETIRDNYWNLHPPSPPAPIYNIPKPLQFLNKLLQSILTPNRNRYRNGDMPSNFYYQ